MRKYMDLDVPHPSAARVQCYDERSMRPPAQRGHECPSSGGIFTNAQIDKIVGGTFHNHNITQIYMNPTHQYCKMDQHYDPWRERYARPTRTATSAALDELLSLTSELLNLAHYMVLIYPET